MILVAVLVGVVATAAADAPVRHDLRRLPELRLAVADESTPRALVDARRLAAALRYEEAVVEYQRYLGDTDRPSSERALALFELAFIHRVLGDEVTAQARAREALAQNPDLTLPSPAPSKQQAFLEEVRKAQAEKPRLLLVAREPSDAPQVVRAQLTDPGKRVARVLLRHSFAPQGPFYAVTLRCTGKDCVGEIPPPKDVSRFSAWYYAEALDAEGVTLAQAASPLEPLGLTVAGQTEWYQSPWVWGIGGATLVAVAGIVYLLVPAPSR